MAKRKRSTVSAAIPAKETPVPLPPGPTEGPVSVPIKTEDVVDEKKPPQKKRAVVNKKLEATKSGTTKTESIPKVKEGVEGLGDPEAEGEELAGEEEIKEALSRPPPVNSNYLPLPWKGRLGYACLNTYLRYSTPSVFSSRTCRIASIIEHRHPLKDPSQPEHPTKNRPDKDQPADISRGQKWVESLGLANARDMIKMLRWNDRYGIKFMRLSSEMFPFASHDEYGYTLAPFAAETLAEVGKVVAELGHRVTTHPGQFTQLGSPRKQVVENAIRDLEYHDEMLSLLKLPPQQDRDAVMILHMGGMFGSKPETLDRFRENYAKLSPSIKNRLVLENDDMSWSVHDLLPICQELNIPMVLDFHHHNIIFDAEQIREGTKDIVELFPVIKETWTRKNITQKMHYSEPTPAAITRMQRRKHSPRVATLPPCADDMDLMIEAKDKEQAVFELMRTFKLPGYERINDIIPHARKDDNKLVAKPKKKATPKKKKGKVEDQDEVLEEVAEEIEEVKEIVSDEEVGMGGPEGRVYWPPGMEEWLRPKKREVKKKDGDAKVKTPKKNAIKDEPSEVALNDDSVKDEDATPTAVKTKSKKKKKETAVPTPSTSDAEDTAMEIDFEADVAEAKVGKTRPPVRSRKSQRGGKISYAEPEHSDSD